MDVLGIIPARGGSKGIPRKSIAPLLGRPLLSYTANAALESRCVNRLILTTDDEEIAAIGRSAGLEVPFKRPTDLSGDDIPVLRVMQHALRMLEANEGYIPAGVVLLQPTSPLRRAEHIEEAVKLFKETGADSVVSVVNVPHQFSPLSVLQLTGVRLKPWVDGPIVTRRQDKPMLYARNGPAVLVSKRTVLLEGDSLYGMDCRPFFMTAEDSIDIDTPFDLKLATLLLSERSSPKPA